MPFPRSNRTALALTLWACAVVPVAFGVEPIAVEGQVTLATDVDVPAEATGRIATISVREGDRILAGQQLATLSAQRAMGEAERARQELEIARLQRQDDVDRRYAEKTLEVQLQELARRQAANEAYAKSIPLTEIRRLELLVEQSRLSMEKADRDLRTAAIQESLKEAELQLAILGLQLHHLASPTDGIVVSVYRQPGEWAEAGDPLVRVIRLDRLRVEAFVQANQVADSWVGGHVRFRPAPTRGVDPAPDDSGETVDPTSGDKEFYNGTVVFISPELNAVTGQCRVWAEVDNHDGRLRPGMRGTLLFDVSP